MTRQHHFHLDHAGHSITVEVRTGHTPEVALLVDGKEVGYRHQRGTDATVLTSELPDEPALPFELRLDHLRHATRSLTCTLLLDGHEIPMPERTHA
jgi:hypothetical protein